MKRTPREIDELEGLALELGATIEYEDGGVFNSKGRRGSIAIDDMDDQPKANESSKQMEQLLKSVADIAARPVHVTVDQPPQVAQPKKPVSWTFEFERNGDGTIKRIHASPKE